VPFAYYKRLPARARRIYDQSNQVSRVKVPEPERLAPQVAALARALQRADRSGTEIAARQLTAALLQALGVSGVRLRVLAKRPARRWGELHGLYEPEGGKLPLVTVWMRTAQRRDVVAFRTFLRTLLHEIGHHLDYELLELDDSLHTEGFYKRESSLFRQLVPDAAALAAAATPSAAAASRPKRRRRPEGTGVQTRLPFADS
jgi:hypothetical protein